MIAEVLDIEPGITAVIGSGGKTSLIKRLAWELADKGFAKEDLKDPAQDFSGGKKIIICTTTHIMRPVDEPVFEAMADKPAAADKEDRPDTAGGKSTQVEEMLSEFIRRYNDRPVYVGVSDPENPKKLVSFPAEIIKRAAGKEAYILAEADGAKHLPMKAHNDSEPVIPKDCERVILVIGAEGFGRPVSQAVHRPEIFMKLAGADRDETVTPGLLAKVLLAERKKYGNCRLQVLVNRTAFPGKRKDTVEQHTSIPDREEEEAILRTDIENARELARLTGWEIYAGNVSGGKIIKV